MDRIKKFLQKRGFYIALGTGILAFVGLMVVYNYNHYKDELGMGNPSVDLNAPADTSDEGQQSLEAQAEQSVTEANSGDAVAGATDATAESADTAGTDKTGSTDTAGADNTNGTNVASTNQTGGTDVAGSDKTNGTDVADTDKTDGADTVSTDKTNGADTDGTDEQVSTLEADSDGVIVDSNGEIVANSYNEGGVLVWPAEGKVILPYSMDTTVYFKTLKCYRCNPGILISAEEGSNVLAAYEGVVESVSEDKEHGTVVTVIMGNGYKAKYGQLMNVTVSEGDTIATAQNIGEVAPVTSYYAEEGNHVYFELTKNDVPVNPTIFMQ